MRNAILSALCTSIVCAISVQAAGPIRVMLLDGEADGPWHKWQATTPALKKQLDDTGLFQVDVVTAPPAGADYSQFKPDFSKYQVVVFNYNAPDERWPADLKTAFEQYMSAGGGLVIVHAACVGFPGWQAFNQMIGVGGWRGRNEKAGPYWYWKDGKLVADNSPGTAGSHGARLPYRVTIQNPNHPITKGLPKVFLHHSDELYAKLRGPGGMSVLATSYSDVNNKGTGNEEPALMVLTFGKGRVFSTTFGHDVLALSSIDGVVTFLRGTEWAATGKVTQKLPASLPDENTVVYRADIAAMDPNFKKGMNPLDVEPPKPAPKPAGTK